MAEQSETGRRWFKNPIIIVTIIVALIGAIATLVAPLIKGCNHEGPNNIEVIITSPANNSEITGDSSQIEGYLNKKLDAGQYLYAVVETAGALWWPTQVIPTYSQVSESYEFKCTLWIKMDNGRETLEIKVIMVDLAIHDNFQTWRSNCIAADDWPGIPIDNVSEWGEWETYASVTVIYE
jgi:hypothetical protein